jgi:phage-related protein
MKKSQTERVKLRLEQTGEISRNECLRNYISRLSAIIYSLKKEGYEFTEFSRKGDYVYKVVVTPKDKIDLEEYEYRQLITNENYV